MRTDYFFQGTYGYVCGTTAIVSNFANHVYVVHDGDPVSQADGMRELLAQMEEKHFGTSGMTELLAKHNAVGYCRWHVASWTKLDS